ncbi:MAG: flagellar hook-basal body complex protein FliE [Proteobacteria bacterium]|nr:flagellar hook-basal body complex protein FliE [Pseudomonadota bacterium]
MAINNIAMNAYRNAIESGKVHERGAGSLSKIGKNQSSDNGVFGKTIKDSLQQVNDLQSEKASMIQEFASGERQNVHELMITLQKAGLAMKMTSAVRNKVMDAYKELSKISF